VLQKVAREEVVKTMPEILANHAASNFQFHFLFTGDESRLLYAYHIRTIWILCPENADQVQRPSHIAKKTTAIVFFKETQLHIIDTLPQNEKIGAEYCAEHGAYYRGCKKE
jgi:hypothetical protein